MADDCIFCAIAAGNAPSERVDEDEHTVAFMDISPWTRGHALVVPRRHYRNIWDIDDDELKHVVAAARRLALRMREQLDCDGVNLLNSTEAVAWQTIYHFHLHVIPRYEGDELRMPPKPRETDEEERTRIAEALRRG
jgi:histidine triad (HIT) family protein